MPNRNERQIIKVREEDIPKPRNQVVQDMISRGWGAGKHQNRPQDVAKGTRRRDKHQRSWEDRMAERVADDSLSRTASGTGPDALVKNLFDGLLQAQATIDSSMPGLRQHLIMAEQAEDDILTDKLDGLLQSLRNLPDALDRFISALKSY